ncbi:hypothetical protein CDAR_252261 [Caerostris darwini]|uniref:Ycf2 n=1 Tax=Caerostris darwini TaxID=1538125 RepID=A0AAV4Q923_9ARAC|nr:hypothetical protein CDAR_252261 [Caerostris darwini]
MVLGEWFVGKDDLFEKQQQNPGFLEASNKEQSAHPMLLEPAIYGDTLLKVIRLQTDCNRWMDERLAIGLRKRKFGWDFMKEMLFIIFENNRNGME